MDVIYDLVMCCVIFHNMINEDKWDQNLKPLFYRTNVAHLKRHLNIQAYMESTHKL